MMPVADNLPDLALTVFNSGWVPTNKKLALSGAASEHIRMPALFAMIRHPQKGVILYDTGYNTRFYEATEKWPFRVMRYLTPAEIREEDNADRQVNKKGIKPEDVGTIILGHGHVDHVPGVVSFPNAKVIVERREWEAMQGSALAVFRHAYLKSLYEGLTNEIEQKDILEQGKPYGPFERALDLWDDGSMILTPLPGHTPGQMGLMVNMPDGRRFFFIGDAAWLSENYLYMKPPAFIARTILSSFDDYMNTLKLIHGFQKENPDVTIVPSHCPATWEKLSQMGVAG
jgi:glyoxylase-like metal-dependent hydrolase (beta-lactamase superfamily II)